MLLPGPSYPPRPYTAAIPPTVLGLPYAAGSTSLPYLLRACYGMSGTDEGMYDALGTVCAVLMSAMLLPGWVGRGVCEYWC
eukprot:1500301-Rhodomonas_salina.4